MTAALRVLEYNLMSYRRIWRGTLFSTFLSPILFLAALGIGLGSFVDQSGSAALGGVSYAVFLAPGLLAGQAMQTAGFESTYPIMGSIIWDRTYHGMLATPITVPGIVFGQLAWLAFRLTLVATAFFGVMVAFGLVASPLGVLAVPVAVLTGLAFGAPIMAYAATQKNDQGFSAVFRFGLTPMFLFSGTFFPIDQLPRLLEIVAEILPLHHGVALARHLVLGDAVDRSDQLAHVIVLVAYVVVGTAGALYTFRRTLVR
ncbi:MAG: ABC transporter permease [Chloroflexota bacterium]|nr:ABC transporter permease [Chloroflexota bacterium]